MRVVFFLIGLLLGVTLTLPDLNSPYMNYRMYKEGGDIVTFRMYDTIKTGTEFILNGHKYTVCGFEFGRNEEYPILEITEKGTFKIKTK